MKRFRMSDTAPESTVISEVAGLRSVYREPAPLVLDKAIPVIDEAAAGFIAASPLVVLATGDGNAVRRFAERWRARVRQGGGFGPPRLR